MRFLDDRCNGMLITNVLIPDVITAHCATYTVEHFYLHNRETAIVALDSYTAYREQGNIHYSWLMSTIEDAK